MEAIYKLDAVSLLQAYRDENTSPTEVIAELLPRVVADRSITNSFCQLHEGIELDALASASRWTRKSPMGPLDGIPIIVKDNLAVRGMPASWGNAELSRRMIKQDELPIDRLRKAGALIVGKANTPEFAVEGYTANATFGVTTNPYNTDLTPGGSSGGVAAAVASGIATMGIGTDGGGSIRRPAAYCGLIGFKPGIGHVARANGLPQVLMDFEVVGPMTRTVRDARLMDAVLSGASRQDPESRRRIKTAQRRSLRVLYVSHIMGEPCDPIILAAVNAAVDQFANLGHHIVADELPLNLENLVRNWSTIAEIGLSRLFEEDKALADSASNKYREMASRGRLATLDTLWSLQRTVRELRTASSILFADWDLIITPTCAAMPWKAADTYPPVIDHVAVGPRGHAVYSGWVNAIGHPALSLPAQPTVEGLPIGIQLIGDLGSESVLLDVAEEHQKKHGGFIWPIQHHDSCHKK